MDKWISVKDRLPENGQKVLVWREYESPTQCSATFRKMIYGRRDAFVIAGAPSKSVTHWRILLAPPQIRFCKFCGESFDVNGHKNKVFCSQKCAHHAAVKRSRAKETQ